jgi:hypothetical protein|tara:strand:- start:1132 stop:1539 length:408 start_codon:yes stop_codon:yes gene_type:complete
METTYDTMPTPDEIRNMYEQEMNTKLKPVQQKEKPPLPEPSPQNATKDLQNEQIKSPDKTYVHTGIVTKLDKANSRYGFSYKIELNHGPIYFFNSKTDIVNQLFKLNEKAAFTVKLKPGKEDKIWFIVDQILYTF